MTPPEETVAFSSFNQPIKDLQKLEDSSLGLRLNVRSAIAKQIVSNSLVFFEQVAEGKL